LKANRQENIYKIMAKIKYHLFFIIALIILISALQVDALDVFKKYEKVIFINQVKQVGTAYEEGKKLFEFPIVTGDDETTTNPGIYVIRLKDDGYYSRKYDTPMPYSMFFDLNERKAIHEGEVPPPHLRKELATHGCIHVEPPYIQRLFEWSEEGKTAVVISGWRTGD
jgi:lipoprotein-anchoring transpeptidase ErfK/SrfK